MRGILGPWFQACHNTREIRLSACTFLNDKAWLIQQMYEYLSEHLEVSQGEFSDLRVASYCRFSHRVEDEKVV